MNKPMKFTLLTAMVAMTLTACGSSSSKNNSTSSVTAADGSNSTSESNALSKLFPQSTTVFDIPIYATAATPKNKILHAANVMAEYLDNDEDGIPDNPLIVARLKSQAAALLMAKDFQEMEPLFEKLPEGNAYQDLNAQETIPGGAAKGQFDAALEEVLHLITHVGYAGVYPGVFGENTGSAIADAMDTARGGQFTSIPSPYPAGAWYTYDDATCDYSCMVTEYTYWSLTSVLGAQTFSGRLAEIESEWKLNTPDKVRTQDVAVHTILTDAQYALATVLPDGNYGAKTFEIVNSTKEGDSSTVTDSTDADSSNVLQDVAAANSGHKIAFGDEFTIYMMDPDGTGVQELANGSPNAGYVSWGPQAEYVYFASTRGPDNSAWEAFRVDVKSLELTQLSLFGEDVRSLGVSPDGKYIAMSIMNGNSNIGNNNDNLTQFHTDIYIIDMMDAETIWSSGNTLIKSDMRLFVSSPAAEQFWYEELNWNPALPNDGEEPTLAFTKTWRYDEDDVSYTHVYTILADGNDEQLIVENKDQPIWGFSGKRLTFLDFSYHDFTDDQLKQLQVSGFTEETSAPAISPDGKFVVFEIGDENRQAGIARLSEEADNDGGLIESTFAYEPRWSPKPVNE